MSSLHNFSKQNQKGFFKLLAQKISQKLDSLAEIVNIQERWIWQLIQNAKDVGNQFGKIKIKLEIHNDHLSFSHNGNLVTPQDLNSIINQYSSKEQENKDDIQTTGKYGTGFITTYILSKKIKLQCRCLNMPSESSSDQQQQQQINKIDLAQKTRPNPILLNQQSTITNKKKIKQQKIKEKEKQLKYQNLSVDLDRQYSNVEQLIKKLEKSQKNLRKQLSNSEMLCNYPRGQDSFDTKFIYEELDDNSFPIIKKGIDSLIYLFPYALLFNPILCSIQITNFTQRSSIQNIKIEREDVKIIFGFYKMFNVSFCNFQNKQIFKKVKNDDITVKSFLYFQYKETNSMVAFPVQYINNKINLLKFDAKYPKIFKDFPLIGSKDIGFNFVFNSKEFYPAETRKQLLLKKCYGRETNKTIKNWEIINDIFKNLQQSLILFKKIINKGKFNLFILPSQENHCFCEKQMESYKFDSIIKKISTNIFQSKIFPSKNYEKDKKMYSITEIMIPYWKRDKKISLKMNQLFSNLMKNKTLQTQQYQQLLQALNSKNIIFPDKLDFITLDSCIQNLSSKNFDKFNCLLQTTDKALQNLKNIYKFLIPTRISSAAIILTMDLKFQQLYDQREKMHLKLNKNFKDKQKYQQILQNLKINYKNRIIHDSCTQIFEPFLTIQMAKNKQKQKQKGQNTLQKAEQNDSIFADQKWYISRIINLFIQKQNKFDKNERLQKVLTLGKVLLSFDIQQSQCIQYAKKMKNLKQIRDSYLSQKIELYQLQNVQQIQALLQPLVQKFDEQFLLLIVGLYQESDNMETFSAYFTQKRHQLSFQLINYIIKRCHKIPKYPNKIGQIIKANQIKVLNKNESNLANQDYKIYQICSKHLSPQKKSLQQLLIHPNIKIPEQMIKNGRAGIKYISYAELFKFINDLYHDNRVQKTIKSQILQYCFYIYEGYKIKPAAFKHKYQAFKGIIDNRHLQFSKSIENLSDAQKDLITKILRKRQDIIELNQIISNYDIKYIAALMKQMQKQK